MAVPQIDFRDAFVRNDILDGALRKDLAKVQHRDPLRDLANEAHVMLHRKDGDAVSIQRLDDFAGSQAPQFVRHLGDRILLLGDEQKDVARSQIKIAPRNDILPALADHRNLHTAWEILAQLGERTRWTFGELLERVELRGMDAESLLRIAARDA